MRIELVPVMKSRLPTTAAILPYLHEIDKNEKYCNFGPLELELRRCLGNEIDVEADQITTFCNGTIALTAVLKTLAIPHDTLCLMPSWTFTATPASAMLAGLTPYFIDVDEQTWALDPATVKRELKSVKGKVGAVMVVSPFGDPVDMKAWEEFRADTGIPVVVDAAGAWDSLCEVPSFYVSDIPVMVSLHGTKPLGIGEGGMVACRDREFIHRLRGMTVFGFARSRGNSDQPSLNGKLSEYAAAVGLAALDGYAEKRAHFVTLRNRYMDIFARLGITHRLSGQWISVICNMVAPSQAEALAEFFAGEGIETRYWWEQGCHRQDAYKDCPAGSLEVTEKLARSALGLPFFYTMTGEQVARVEAALSNATSVKQLTKAIA